MIIPPVEKVTIINVQMLQLDGAIDSNDSEEVESENIQFNISEDMFEYQVKISIIIVGAILICIIIVLILILWIYKQKNLTKENNVKDQSVMEMEAQHEEPEHNSSNPTTILENTEEDVIKRKKKTEGGQ